MWEIFWSFYGKLWDLVWKALETFCKYIKDINCSEQFQWTIWPMDMLRLHEPRSYLLFSGQLFRSRTLPSSFLFQQLSVDILYFKTMTSFNKNLRKCFSSEHTWLSLNAWLTVNLSMFRVWRNIMKTLMCVALIKRSVASLLENLTARSKNGALRY